MTNLHFFQAALFAASSAFALACVEDETAQDYACDVVWSRVTPDGNDEDDELDVEEVGMATIDYTSLVNAEEAILMCEEDQLEHPDRPQYANSHTCDCASK